jgi:hypothetical protein
MHIHLPKAPHGLREALREVGVIVVGIVIAILLEQGAEQWHWFHEVQLARTAIHAEMRNANSLFAYRVAAGPCIARRLDDLEAIVEKVARHEPVPKLGPIMPDIGGPLNDNIWESHRASQTLTHFDDRELEPLGYYYIQLRNALMFETDEIEAVGVLRVLQGDPARLGPADVAGLRVAIQHARFDNNVLQIIAAAQLNRAKALGVETPAPEAARVAEICAALPVLAKP